MVKSPVVVLMFVLFAVPARSQQVAPAVLRAAISELKQAIVRADAAVLARVLSDDVDLWTGGILRETGQSSVAGNVTQRPIWSERGPAYLKNESIRVVSADVALVDARWVRYGSTGSAGSPPVLFVLKKEGPRWLVASIRIILQAAGPAVVIPAR